MIHGARKNVVKARIWIRIVWLALRAYRNPVRALGTLRLMIAMRATVQTWVTGKYAAVSGRYFWNFYSPGWPGRAFDRYVEHELNRIAQYRSGPATPLQAAIIGITRACALKCEHCFEWDILNRPERLTRADLLEICADLRRRGAVQLLLSGGEPLRRFDDLVAVVSACSAEADVWILTSGVGLTRERAQTLRDAGLTGAAISLDHWRAEDHDRFRGITGGFEWVERAAAHAREAGLVVTLSLCPTRDFVSDENLEAYAQVAHRLRADFVQILEPKAVGHYAGKDVSLSREQQVTLERFFERLNTDPALRDFPAASYPDRSSRAVGCGGAGDRHLYVDTDGDLHGCPYCRKSAGSALGGEFESSLGRLQAAGCGAAITQ